MAAITRLLGLPSGSGQLSRAAGGALAGTGGIDSASLLFSSCNIAVESAASGTTNSLSLGYYAINTDGTSSVPLVSINGDPNNASHHLLLGPAAADPDGAKVGIRAETLFFQAKSGTDATTAVIDGHWSVGTSALMGASGGIRNADIYGALTVHGDLLVDGTTITVNAEDMLVEDNMILLNAGPTSSTALAGWAVQSYYSDVASEADQNFHRQFLGGFGGSDPAIGTQEATPGGSALSDLAKINIQGFASALSSTTNYYNGMWIKIDDTGHNGHGDVRKITAWDATNKLLTVTPDFSAQVEATAKVQIYIDQVGMLWDESQDIFKLASVKPDGSAHMPVGLGLDMLMCGYGIELNSSGPNSNEPSPYNDNGTVYAKTVGGIEELFFVSMDGGGNTVGPVQVTSNGGVNAAITGDLSVDGQNAIINADAGDDQVGALKVRWDSDSDNGTLVPLQVSLSGTASAAGSDVVELSTKALSIHSQTGAVTEGATQSMTLRLGDGVDAGADRAAKLVFHGRAHGGGTQVNQSASFVLEDNGNYEGDLSLDKQLRMAGNILPDRSARTLGSAVAGGAAGDQRWSDAFFKGLDVYSNSNSITLEVEDDGSAHQFLKLTSGRIAGNVGKLAVINAATGNLAATDLVCIDPASGTMAKADAGAISTSMPIGIMLADCVATASVLGKVSQLGTCATVSCVAPSTTMPAGSPVFLSGTAGKVQFTMPSTAGDYVVQVGISQASAGTSSTSVVISFLPAFMRIANGS